MIFEKMRQQIVVYALVLVFGCSVGFSQQPAPPENVNAFDTPNDAGASITITWDKSPEDGTGAEAVTGYHVLRKSGDSEFEVITKSPLTAGETRYVDKGAKGGPAYTYSVQAITASESTVNSAETAPVKAVGNWFHFGKRWIFLALILFSVAVVYSIYHARRGKEIFIRRIPGLEAVDEAIGRSTEMGRPIMYILGLGSVSDVATIASMNILSQVARKTADYEMPLRVPCNDPIVLNVVREMVRTAYVNEGRPDAYQEDDIFFLTESQFAYAAGVDGMMIREKPAAIFMQGTFYAESLILAETGNSVGAIQIAGTDSDSQLPFFIAACDYTLIGEELYAASAYLSREPMLIGSLRGQDYGKLIIFGALIIGVILELIGVTWVTTFFQRV
ncbi:MAG: fibronectin type III domain-containing protein [Candidatus Poribacteria bacterium]|nr:fibronectin type III domain-containing protein [Candidatus Poribacteria bacterium]